MVTATRAKGKPAAKRTDQVQVHRLSNFEVGDVVVNAWNHYDNPVVAREFDVPAVPGSVTLVLTDDEAQWLADVTYRIGGDPRTSRRKFADHVSAALCDVDVRPSSRHIADISQGLVFEDGPDSPTVVQ